MIKLLLFWCFLPSATVAQALLSTPPAISWEYGLAMGNGAAIQLAHFRPHIIALGRVRGKWWHADAPSSGIFGLFEDPETRSRQIEIAALFGYPVVVGRSRFYAATGVGYVNGQQAGEYRYTQRTSGLLSNPKNFYAHNQYQALGLPLEVGWQSPGLGAKQIRVGLTSQANINPQQSAFCLLATIWFGNNGVQPHKRHE